MIAVPAQSFIWATAIFWFVELTAVFRYLLAATWISRQLGAIDTPTYVSLAESVRVLSIYSWSLGAVVLLYGTFLIMDIIPMPTRANKIVSGSRTFRVLIIWTALGCISQVATFTIQLPGGFIALLVSIGLELTAFVLALLSLGSARHRARQWPLLYGLTNAQLRDAQIVERPWGPGRDFPRSPEQVGSRQEALGYANLARRRQRLREQLGAMTRIVAGAFIGTVGIWALFGGDTNRLWALIAVVFVVWIGFAIERRHQFWRELASGYEARALRIGRRQRQGVPSRNRVSLPRRVRTRRDQKTWRAAPAFTKTTKFSLERLNRF